MTEITNPLRLALIGVATLGLQSLAAQDWTDAYWSHQELMSEVERLGSDYRNLLQIDELGESAGGREIPVLTLSANDDPGSRPALLVVANAHGPHVIGSHVALALARRLLADYRASDPQAMRILDGYTVYLVPRLNPDGAEAMFRSPRMEKDRNDWAYDEDRDWATDEDGPDDLNGDGLITMQRVRDSAGAWRSDSADAWLMVEANRTRGEAGEFRLMVEGRDDDDDGSWNEDPAGGADPNRNFGYQYEFFGATSGRFQMDAPEARALGQFMIDHPNVAVAYVLGPQDNLIKPWEHRSARGIAGNPEGTSQGGPYSSILEGDQPYFEEMSRRFKDLTGLEDGVESADIGGDVLSWLYYHMGRLAFGSRVWWIPEVPLDSGETTISDDRVKEARNQLRWLRSNNQAAVVDWTPVDHPDFPEVEVEIGGFAPYALLNPPASEWDSIVAGQNRFFRELAASLPSVAWDDVTVTRLGSGTFRVEANLVNSGYLPTLAAIGERADWPRRIRVDLQTDGQEVVGGQQMQLLDAIEGSGAAVEFSWVVVGRDGSSITLSASSPVAGNATHTVELR